MNQPKHTPGPWHVLDHPNREYFVYGPDGNLVANCDGWINHTLADKQANARLIAAAPELLEACNTIFKLFVNTAKIRGNDVVLELSTNPDDIEMEYDKLLNLMSNAIKKAEGES